MTVSQWADTHRVLSSESSAKHGQWSTNDTPYLREIMDTFNDPKITEITIQKSAQIGYTELLTNVICFYTCHEPSPIMLIQPTLQMAEAYSLDRLSPAIRDTPLMRRSIGDSKSKTSGNTILHKQFKGGHITLVGANSAAGLASRPIRILLCDEIDRFPQSAGNNGDPLKLAFDRTQTFWNRKIVHGSTPVLTDTSLICKKFEQSDKRYFYVPCPHCEQLQTLEWESVKWDNDDKGAPLPDTAYIECKHCNGKITDKHKMPMLKKGIWKASKPTRSHAGFFINALYSPFSGARLPYLVQAFHVAKQEGEQTMQVFYNNVLGLPYDDKLGVGLEQFTPNIVPYAADVPMGALILTAGVDVQANRLEVNVIGWGIGENAYFIEYRVIYGDPELMDVWEELDEFLKKDYKHALGVDMGISGAVIDSGYTAQMVYKFCNGKLYRGIFAGKGVSGSNRPVVQHSRAKKNQLLIIGVDNAKSIIYTRLKLSSDKNGSFTFPAGGNYDSNFFEQLTCEKVKTDNKGIRKFFKPAGKRNEALDTTVYALAAMNAIRPMFKALDKNLKLKAGVGVESPNIKNAAENLKHDDVEKPPVIADNKQRKSPTTMPRRKAWMKI